MINSVLYCLVLTSSAAVAIASNSRQALIADRVKPVCSVQPGSKTTLLVRVVDDTGAPMNGISVRVAWRSTDTSDAEMPTDRNGEARFVGVAEGLVRISADYPGFARSVAERVAIKRQCFSAVMLPMQVVAPKDSLDTVQPAPGRAQRP